MVKSADKIGPKQPRLGTLPPPPPEEIARALKVRTLTIEWLAGDGSDRCYYRVASPELQGPMVLMQLSGQDAVALKAGGYDWIKIATMLAGKGILVPRVIAAMPDHAALIIEDYGDVMLEGKIFQHADRNEYGPIRQLYQQAVDIIARFLNLQAEPNAVWTKRSFDAERFAWELRFFMQQYATPVVGIRWTSDEQVQFDAEVNRLATALAANSKYFVHRDFHSRNVMVRGSQLAVIDFQDARLGPASYDLVSLCFDSYVPFTADTRMELFKNALALLKKEVGESVHSEIEELWKPMLLQRQLKAIGSFGYLTLDKKRGDYLKYVPPALQTMEDAGVGDDRWPLLSRTLLKRIRNHVLS
jgi:aminoglycoside/choline kinase family phosphotransferase